MKSCIKTLITALALCATTFSFANNMKSSFNDAMNEGKSQSGKGSAAITSFDPSSVMSNYTANPSEVNLRGDASSLGSLGMQELNNSEVGKAINDSTINNPKIKIDENADFLQVSDGIRQNAAAISGMKSGKQCVNQVLSKTSYTNHYCEKDQAVNQVCTRTADVKWVGSKTFKSGEKTLVHNRIRKDFRYGNYAYTNASYLTNGSFKMLFELPKNIIVTGFDYTLESKSPYLSFANRSNFLKTNYIFGKEFNHNYVDRKKLSFSENGLNYSTGDNTVHSLDYLSISSFAFMSYFLNENWYEITLKVYYKELVEDIKPELVWIDSCSNTNTEDSIKISEKCTQAGGNRVFTKNGKTYTLNSECWQYQEEYLVGEASDNECKAYENNSNCSVTERECILSQGGKCLRFRNKYQCSKVTKTDGYLCGDEFFCSDGSCADLEGSVNTDFGHAVSQLANLAKASEDYDYDEQKFRAFSGRAMFCRKSGFGYSDCCKDSGWGQSAGLAKCNDEEQMLGQAKEKKTAVFVGTFCSRKVLGKCVQRKSGYCVFDNKLARITQVQGRSGQLGFGFGGASNPDCRGLTVDELQSIDFNAMDYSDFYDELNSNTEVPNKDQMIDYMKKSITEQMKQ